MTETPSHSNRYATAARDGLFVGVSILAISWAAIVLLYYHAAAAYKEEIRTDLLRLAHVAAQLVDGDLHHTLVSPDQYGGDAYNRILGPLRKFCQMTPDLKYVYTVVWKDQQICFGVDAAEPIDGDGDGVIDQSQLFELWLGVDPTVAQALRDGRAAATPAPYHDKWGTFMTGCAPFYDSSGSPIGLACVDITVSQYEQRLWRLRLATIVPLGGTLLFSVLAGWTVYRVRRSETDRGEARSAVVQRTRRQQELVAGVAASSNLAMGNTEALARELTERTVQTMELQRVAVWLFDAAQTELCCIDAYDRHSCEHTSGVVLREADFRREFEAMKSSKYVDARDSISDPRTSGYFECRLDSQTTAPILNAVIRLAGRPVGCVCLEHVNHEHRWENNQIAVACQLADQVALSIANNERNRTEQALRDSERKLVAAFVSCPDVIFITEWASGLFIQVNEAVRWALGYEPSEMIGRTSIEIKLWANQQERDEFRSLLKEQGQISQHQLRHRHKSGRLVDMSVSARRLVLDGRECILAVLRDITEQKRAEQAIEKRLVALTQPLDESGSITFDELFNLADIQRLQDEFASATGVSSIITRPDGLPITNPSNYRPLCHDLIVPNKNAITLCHSSYVVLGRPADGPIIEPCQTAGLWCAGAAILVGGQHIASWLIGQARDGTQTEESMRQHARRLGLDEDAFVERFHKVPVMPSEQFERVARVLFTLASQLSSTAYQNVQQARFITERRHAEEELLQSHRRLEETTARASEMATRAGEANRAKSEFLANMSHEIRTPMTAILGFADVLLEQTGDNVSPERVQAVHTIKNNGEYLLQILNDILDLSKIEAGKMSVEQIACSPCHIIAEVASLMRVRAEAKGLPFHIEYTGSIPQNIHTDPTRLRQILFNVIGNAIKFTETGQVRLVARFSTGVADKGYLHFDVVDTGIGMTPQQVGRLFEAFVQGDNSTVRKFGGTGLGLTICKRLAQMLGGDILVIDTEPGKGTRIRVTIATGSLDGVHMVDDPMSATAVGIEASKPSAVAVNLSLEGRRILLAEDGPDNQRLISHLLKKAGAEVTVAENGAIAAKLAQTAAESDCPFDVILMDMQMPVMDGYEATRTLRAENYTGVIIALTAHAMAQDREKCLDAGCDDYATKPVDRKLLLSMIDRYIRERSRSSPAATTSAVGAVA